MQSCAASSVCLFFTPEAERPSPHALSLRPCLLWFVRGREAIQSCQICHSRFFSRVYVCLSPSYFPITRGPSSCHRVIATYTQPLSLCCWFGQSLGNVGLGLCRFFLWLSRGFDVSVPWAAWTSRRTFHCAFPYRTSSKPEACLSASTCALEP
jgi:hypothetical protein